MASLTCRVATCGELCQYFHDTLFKDSFTLIEAVPETVLRLLKLLPDSLDFCLEAPCATWRETLSVRRRCHIPIILDELIEYDADIAHLIAQDAADGVGLKITKAGGLTRSRRHRDMCRASGLTMSVQDTVGSTIAFAVIAHLGQTVPQNLLRCILDCREMVSVSTAAFDAPVTKGGVLTPNSPGLGVAVNTEVFGNPVCVYQN